MAGGPCLVRLSRRAKFLRHAECCRFGGWLDGCPLPRGRLVTVAARETCCEALQLGGMENFGKRRWKRLDELACRRTNRVSPSLGVHLSGSGWLLGGPLRLNISFLASQPPPSRSSRSSQARSAAAVVFSALHISLSPNKSALIPSLQTTSNTR